MKKKNILKGFIYIINTALICYLMLVAFILTQIWVNDDIAFRVGEGWWLREAIMRFFELSIYGFGIAIIAFFLNKGFFYWISKSDSTKLALRIGLMYFSLIVLANLIGSIIFYIEKPYF